MKATRLTPEQRRAQIIEVATRHLTNASYDALSIQDLAAEAGVTRALIHHYFGGKEGLFEAVIERELARLLELTAPDPALTAEQHLDQALGAYLDYFSASGGELRSFYAAVPSAPKRNHPVADAHAVQIDRIVAAMDVPDSARNRIAIAAWLTFVVEAAKEASEHPDITRHEVLEMCKAALHAVVNHARG